MPHRPHAPLWLILSCAGPLAGCAGATQSASSGGEQEWRRRADTAQDRYQELSRETDRLLEILPRATTALEPAALRQALLDHRRLGELVKALDRRLADARDAQGEERYRVHLRCPDHGEGHYAVALVRKGQKPKARGARTRLVERTACPSVGSVDVGPQQAAPGEYRLEVSYEARRPSTFAFEVRRVGGGADAEALICSGGTGAEGPPRLENACDLLIQAAAPQELPVAR